MLDITKEYNLFKSQIYILTVGLEDFMHPINNYFN